MEGGKMRAALTECKGLKATRHGPAGLGGQES